MAAAGAWHEAVATLRAVWGDREKRDAVLTLLHPAPALVDRYLSSVGLGDADP